MYHHKSNRINTLPNRIITHVHERIHADLARVRVVRVKPVRVVVVVRRATATAAHLQAVQDANLLRLKPTKGVVRVVSCFNTLKDQDSARAFL